MAKIHKQCPQAAPGQAFLTTTITPCIAEEIGRGSIRQSEENHGLNLWFLWLGTSSESQWRLCLTQEIGGDRKPT